MEFAIRNMMEQDKQEVLDMMRVFYASPAVQSNGSDEIFENDIRTCIEGSPYLEGYVFEMKGSFGVCHGSQKLFHRVWKAVCLDRRSVYEARKQRTWYRK